MDGSVYLQKTIVVQKQAYSGASLDVKGLFTSQGSKFEDIHALND